MQHKKIDQEKIKELELKLQALAEQVNKAKAQQEDRAKILHERLEALSNKLESSETKVSNIKSKYAKALI